MGMVQAADIDLEDGTYYIEVTLSGGSGRASVTSPAKLVVEERAGTAEIEWSSSNYDYMVVGDETYYPVNSEGNSVFEIPVTCYDSEMAVTADTTAMSVPHEIEYSLTFASASVQAAGKTGGLLSEAGVAALAILVLAAAVFVLVRRKFRKQSEK